MNRNELFVFFLFSDFVVALLWKCDNLTMIELPSSYICPRNEQKKNPTTMNSFFSWSFYFFYVSVCLFSFCRFICVGHGEFLFAMFIFVLSFFFFLHFATEKISICQNASDYNETITNIFISCSRKIVQRLYNLHFHYISPSVTG